jgi:hypothetical protein
MILTECAREKVTTKRLARIARHNDVTADQAESVYPAPVGRIQSRQARMIHMFNQSYDVLSKANSAVQGCGIVGVAVDQSHKTFDCHVTFQICRAACTASTPLIDSQSSKRYILSGDCYSESGALTAICYTWLSSAVLITNGFFARTTRRLESTKTCN